jgi:hypothetical protein
MMASTKISKKALELVGQVQTELQSQASSQKKFWIEKYMKNVIEYRGLQQPDVNSVYKKVCTKEVLASFTLQEKLDVAETLLRSNFGEDKGIGKKMKSSMILFFLFHHPKLK